MKLKTCPFCGKEAKIIKSFNSNYLTVACQSCMAKGPKSVNEKYAIEWWNRRLK